LKYLKIFKELQLHHLKTVVGLCLIWITRLEALFYPLTMANMSNSPITQVSQVPTHTNLQPQLLTRLFLDLRGRRFEVDRETIMNLPESVLLCLFPNGLVLSRQSVALSDGGGDEDDEEVYGVDVRKQQCKLDSILIFYLV
jgi:hypothetical protein